MLPMVWSLVKYSPKNASKANTTIARIANKTIKIRFFTLFMSFSPFRLSINTIEYGDSQQTAANEQQSNSKPHHTVISGLRRIRIVICYRFRINGKCCSSSTACRYNTDCMLAG